MSKEPTGVEPKSIEELMLEDAKPPRPSDLAGMDHSLVFSQMEWQWIDAVDAAKKHGDPQRLIALLEKERVPPRLMPFIAGLLDPKPGRPNLLPTLKQIAYDLAEPQVRELAAEKGTTIAAAAKAIAPQWGLTVKTLIQFCSKKSGNARKLKSKRPKPPTV